MVRDGAFIQAYNAQIAVDEGHQIIGQPNTWGCDAGGLIRWVVARTRRPRRVRSTLLATNS